MSGGGVAHQWGWHQCQCLPVCYSGNGEQIWNGWAPPDCINNAFCNGAAQMAPRIIFGVLCIASGFLMLVYSCVLSCS